MMRLVTPVLVMLSAFPQCYEALRLPNTNHGVKGDELRNLRRPLERTLADTSVHCGCDKCTNMVWQTYAADNTGNYTCGDRIKWLIANNNLDEPSACRQVAGKEFPGQVCGPFCNPDTCSAPTDNLVSGQHCGCTQCTDAIWQTMASDANGDFTCGSRIEWVVANANVDEPTACRQVAGEFPSNVCGPFCNPDACEKSTTTAPSPAPAPTPTNSSGSATRRCGCKRCNSDVLETIASDSNGNFTCGSRIDWVIANQQVDELAACRIVAEQFPAGICGPRCNPDACKAPSSNSTAPTAAPPVTETHCGCKQCNDIIWNIIASDSNGDFTCGFRIEWLKTNNNMDEPAACRVVAGEQFPFNVCGPYCDPDKCG